MNALLVIGHPAPGSFSHALVFNTSNTPQAREREVFVGLCGVTSVLRLVAGPMASSTEAQRAGWLDDVRAMVRKVI